MTDDGTFTDGVGEAFAGLEVLGEGNDAVVAQLESQGSIAHQHEYTHRYPFDWRTKKPVMLRATQQWFADLSDVAPHAQAVLDDVHMIPASGRNRLHSMLESRTDWCISRQRAWGVSETITRTQQGLLCHYCTARKWCSSRPSCPPPPLFVWRLFSINFFFPS